MWKALLFVIFFLNPASDVRCDESLTADIAKTHQSLLQKSKFEDRVLLVDDLLKKASGKREEIMKQKARTNADILALLHINILRNSRNTLDTSSAGSCTKSLVRLKTTLYPNRNQTVLFPFEQSIYDLYTKVCAL